MFICKLPRVITENLLSVTRVTPEGVRGSIAVEVVTAQFKAGVIEA